MGSRQVVLPAPPLPRPAASLRALAHLGVSTEVLWNLPVLLYLPFNGILQLPRAYGKQEEAFATLCFCSALVMLALRNRVAINWSFWTVRIFALMTLETGLSIAWNTQPASTVLYPFIISLLLFCYLNYLLRFVTANDLTRIMVRILAVLLTISIVVSVLIPSFGIDTGLDDPSNVGSWQGIFSQKNQLGMVAVLGMAMALGLRCTNLTDRLWRVLLLGAALVCAAGSRSRETWVAIALQLTVFLFLAVIRRFQYRERLAFTAGSLALGAIVGTLLYTNLDRVLALLGRSRTASGRTYIWEGSLLLIRRRPLLGYGVYGVWRTPVAWEVIARAGWNVPSSHNAYIEILLYLGLVGLVIYAALLLTFVIFCARALLQNRLEALTPAVYVLAGILMLSLASPITVYFPSGALMLLLFFCADLERSERLAARSAAASV